MFPAFLLNPWALLGAMFVILSSCSTGYVAGRNHEANKWKAAEAQSLQALAEAEQYRKEMEYRLSQEAAKKDAEIDRLHRRLNDEIVKATRGTACFGADATRVWNAAFDSIRGLSEGASRVPERSSVSAGAGATDTEVLSRANEVAQILNTCREQINNIRAWDERQHTTTKK